MARHLYCLAPRNATVKFGHPVGRRPIAHGIGGRHPFAFQLGVKLPTGRYGNTSAAARLLGMRRSSLQRKWARRPAATQ